MFETRQGTPARAKREASRSSSRRRGSSSRAPTRRSPQDEVASPGMFDPPWGSHSGSHIDDGRKGVNVGCGADALYVVYSVLETNNGGVWGEVWREGSRGLFRVQRLYTEKHNLCIPCGADLSGCRNLNVLLKMQAVNEQAVPSDGFRVQRTANQGHRRTGARQHSAKIATYRPRTQHGNARPVYLHLSSPPEEQVGRWATRQVGSSALGLSASSVECRSF